MYFSSRQKVDAASTGLNLSCSIFSVLAIKLRNGFRRRRLFSTSALSEGRADAGNVRTTFHRSCLDIPVENINVRYFCQVAKENRERQREKTAVSLRAV